jgi:uncharacterized protein (DUF58 family)
VIASLPRDVQVLIKQLELVSRKLASGPLQSNAHSRIKGTGFEFHQLRDYIQGDDIRYIDWKASSRSNKMLVRQYLEDRNRKLYIVCDISASTEYASDQGVRKSDVIKQIATILAFVSLYKTDAVGLLLVSTKIEKVVPAQSSRQHVLSLINTLYSYEAKHNETNLNAAFEYLARLQSKGTIVCFLSDFLGEIDQKILSVAARRNDILAFRCLDKREISFPEVGTLIFEDRETHERREISGSHALTEGLNEWHKKQKDLLSLAKIDSVDIEIGKPYAGTLSRFLRQRVYG